MAPYALFALALWAFLATVLWLHAVQLWDKADTELQLMRHRLHLMQRKEHA